MLTSDCNRDVSTSVHADTVAFDTAATGRFPDFLVVGAAKGGTTTLWSWLRQCPELFLPATKEPHYFCFANGCVPHVGPELDPHFLATLRTDAPSYRALYAGASALQSAGEASTGYLYHTGTAERIAAANPQTRIICVLRNPVERAFSQFLHHVRDGFEPLHCFADALAAEPQRMAEGWWWGHHYFNAGLYATQWLAYCKAFPKHQRLLLLYDELQADPQHCFDKITAFLGLVQRPLVDPECHENKTHGLHVVPRFGTLHKTIQHGNLATRFAHACLTPRFAAGLRSRLVALNSKAVPVMPPKVAQHLRQRYQGDLRALETITGLDLSHWKA